MLSCLLSADQQAVIEAAQTELFRGLELLRGAHELNTVRVLERFQKAAAHGPNGLIFFRALEESGALSSAAFRQALKALATGDPLILHRGERRTITGYSYRETQRARSIIVRAIALETERTRSRETIGEPPRKQRPHAPTAAPAAAPEKKPDVRARTAPQFDERTTERLRCALGRAEKTIRDIERLLGKEPAAAEQVADGGDTLVFIDVPNIVNYKVLHSTHDSQQFTAVSPHRFADIATGAIYAALDEHTAGPHRGTVLLDPLDAAGARAQVRLHYRVTHPLSFLNIDWIRFKGVLSNLGGKARRILWTGAYLAYPDAVQIPARERIERLMRSVGIEPVADNRHQETGERRDVDTYLVNDLHRKIRDWVETHGSLAARKRLTVVLASGDGGYALPLADLAAFADERNVELSVEVLAWRYALSLKKRAGHSLKDEAAAIHQIDEIVEHVARHIPQQ